MTVDAQARDGFVTLTGTVEWHYQRKAAESRAAGVPGVVGIENAIALPRAPVRVPQGTPSAARSGAMPCWTRTGSRSRPSPAGW